MVEGELLEVEDRLEGQRAHRGADGRHTNQRGVERKGHGKPVVVADLKSAGKKTRTRAYILTAAHCEQQAVG